MVGTSVGGVVLGTSFIFLQCYNGERAIVPFRLTKEHTNYISLIFIFCLGGAFFILLYYLSIYFQAVSGVSAPKIWHP